MGENHLTHLSDATSLTFRVNLSRLQTLLTPFHFPTLPRPEQLIHPLIFPTALR